jgi:hypothetical protein
MRYVDVLEETQPIGRVCFICGAGQRDSHWSNCPFGEGDADTDPDADSSEQSAEIP